MENETDSLEAALLAMLQECRVRVRRVDDGGGYYDEMAETNPNGAYLEYLDVVERVKAIFAAHRAPSPPSASA